jgi:hypothetical protein
VAASTPRLSCPGRTDLGSTATRRLLRIRRILGGGAAGAALAVILTGCFSAPPQIISLEPNRGSTSVAADAPVRVIFDRQVLHSTVAGRFRVSPALPGCDLGSAFTAAPTAPCWVHWLDGQAGFELLHEGAVFAPSSRYTFTLPGGFADPQGDVNGLDHQWDITTAAAPRVAATTPADRSADVPIDAPLAVSFSAVMDAPSTAAAITLSPAVPGTRVVRNLLDQSRFVILPGQLLDPGIAYSINVAATARGEDRQAIFAPASVRFTAGSRIENPHAVVLAGAPGAGSTELLLAALAPAQPGEPIAAPVLMRAPLCAVSTGCGAVAAQAPLQTYAAAAVAGDGLHLAVVIDDEAAGSTRLELLDTVNDAIVATVPDGVRPSWSPDGSQLALLAGSRVEVLDARTGTATVVSDGTGLTAPALWAGETTLVLSVATPGGTTAGVELLSRPLDARYALPGAPAGSTAVAVSPAGSRLALAERDGSVLVLPVGGAQGAAQRLPGRLQALGFAGEGTLVAISDNQDTAVLVRINVVGGDSTGVALTTASPDLQSVRVAPDGRRLAWLGSDPAGVKQAYVANADGSGELALTRFVTGGLEAQAVGFAV